MCRTDDPYRDFDRWDRERENSLEKLPKCECCGEPIQDEDLYDFEDGYLICEECVDEYIKERYKKKTVNYVED